jgi:acetyl-CoA synthetase
MRLGYASYNQLQQEFSWNEAWDLVDGTPAAINAAAECLDRHTGTAAKVVYGDGSTATHSFQALSRKAAQFAHALDDLGTTMDDRVAIMLDPSEEFLVSFFGTMKHGAAAVPCSELFGPEALNYRLEDSEAAVLVTAESVLEGIDDDLVGHRFTKADLLDDIAGFDAEYTAATAGSDEAWVQYTSGTTGRPTAVGYDHSSVAYFAPVMDFVLNFNSDDACLTTSSTGWGTGIWIGTFAPLVLGIQTGYYSGRFDAGLTLSAIEDLEVNTLLGIVPTAYRKLLDAAEARGSAPTIEKAHYVGEPIDEDLSRAIEAAFGTFPRSTYGATELRSVVTLDYGFPDYEFRHGSMGKPMVGLDVSVVDENEAPLPAGEVGRIAFQRADTWVVSDDAAYYDEDGYFWSAGRMDDTIISAAYTIGPQEVEDSLRTHPAVVQAGVIGVPDEERGEVIKAFLEVGEAPSDELRADIRRHVRDRLSKHEYPRTIEFVSEVPTTPDGKIRRQALRDREGIANS